MRRVGVGPKGLSGPWEARDAGERARVSGLEVEWERVVGFQGFCADSEGGHQEAQVTAQTGS